MVTLARDGAETYQNVLINQSYTFRKRPAILNTFELSGTDVIGNPVSGMGGVSAREWRPLLASRTLVGGKTYGRRKQEK
jgi:hypothetical protein